MLATDFIGIIPARYASTRFPGKPLALLDGKPMIEHVYRRVASVLPQVAVATDDARIIRAVEAFGGRAVATSTQHRSGTDRVAEAYDVLGSAAPVIINIQGDEPFIATEQLQQLMHCFDNPEVEIATLARRYPQGGSIEGLADPNLVKVVFAENGRALYFSRSVIPYQRGVDAEKWPSSAVYHTHVGIYAYRADALRRIASMEPSSLEMAESLEQLRWLQNGLNIAVAVTESPTIGIDTPADLAAAEAYISRSRS